MPVSANEPISLLQRASEQLEYSHLLDEAATLTGTSADRLLYISAFAISSLTSFRVKERAIRKPFNPMLGETFELVREDKGFRFLAEKVSHRPLRMACQAESDTWTFTQSPFPTQKFWGKSAELVTDGRVRVILHPTGDRFSWTAASSFLRNILAGEKYIEPVGSVTISNETTGEQAIATFKSKGLFSGRSEDVTVQLLSRDGSPLAPGLAGKWTTSLHPTHDSVPVPGAPPFWAAADLAPDAAKRYGFTAFAASLNEVTPVEAGRLPCTDSRLRPDQRAMEEGDLDRAEDLKTRLEEAQRARRKALEERTEDWTPRWFERVGNGPDEAGEGVGPSGDPDPDPEDLWLARGGRDGYWECRARADWIACEAIFDV